MQGPLDIAALHGSWLPLQAGFQSNAQWLQPLLMSRRVQRRRSHEKYKQGWHLTDWAALRPHVTFAEKILDVGMTQEHMQVQCIL